jgi:hypothetical protein
VSSGIRNNMTLKEISLIKFRLRLYNLLALLFDSKCWIRKAKTKSRLIAAEMEFMIISYNRTDYKSNTEIIIE